MEEPSSGLPYSFTLQFEAVSLSAFPRGGREGHPLRRLGGSAPASRPAPRLARGVWWARAHPPSCLLQLGGRNQVPLPPSAVETAPALCGRFLNS